MSKQTAPKFKFRLEHKGIVVAESDWSNILFDYTRRRPEKAANYTVFNNITGLVAGTPTAKPAVKAVKATTKAKTTTRRVTRNANTVITK